MDQLSMFETGEEIFFREISPQLRWVLDKNWADHSLLSLEKRQNYHSVMFDGSVVVRINGGKRPFLEFPNYGEEIPKGKKSDKYIRVNLESFENAKEYVSYMVNSLQNAINSIPEEFSCCSRYMECSDSISCKNPNKDMAMRCGYRKVLMSGRVFYGQNRNID